jgi:aminobenzoyl-glutamate transport protein
LFKKKRRRALFVQDLPIAKRSRFLRTLDIIERLGNRLPDPFVLFLSFAGFVVLASFLFAGASVVNPGTQKVIAVQNLVSSEGVRRMLTEAIKNFTSFPPLGVVLVVMMGAGIAERSGLFGAGLRQLMAVLPKGAVVPALVFAGVNSSIAADAGIVVLPPLGALLFISVGRHPLAGIAAAFAGVSGGFSAGLLITPLDPLLSGLTETAAHILNPTYSVAPTANWYFKIASTFLLTALGSFVTARVIEPRLGTWQGNAEQAPEANNEQGPINERTGVAAAFIVALVASACIAVLVVPESSLLRDDTGGLKPFFDSLVPLLSLLFALCGVVYGVVVGVVRSHKDVVRMAAESMASMSGYILLAFAAAQFIAYFNWSNLGILLAVKGAGILQGLHLTGPLLLVGFIVIVAFINLLISSASAEWTLLGPIFVPMLMLLGYSPEVVQGGYRVGESVTNIITPLMPYFPILVTLSKKYVPSAGLGTLLSLMLPYSLVFGVGWLGLFLLWTSLGLPFGPGAPLAYP